MISQTMIYTQSTELLSGSFCFYFFSFSGHSALIIKCSITKNTVGSSILEIFILHLAYSCLLNCLRLLSKKRPKFGVDFLAKNKLVDTLGRPKDGRTRYPNMYCCRSREEFCFCWLSRKLSMSSIACKVQEPECFIKSCRGSSFG